MTVSIDQLSQEPYGTLLCFPKPNWLEMQKRIEELRSLGVSALAFDGTTHVHGFPFPVLGKGYVGIVVKAYLDAKQVALKIRRIDADRKNLYHEACMLQLANSVNVGPGYISGSNNFLLMQLIEGELLPDWLDKNCDASNVRQVLSKLLIQCWELDSLGLDHGELSKAPKHVIIDSDKNPWIVDFETSSNARKPANVSAICQYLTMSGGPISQKISAILGEKNRIHIIETIKVYKKIPSRETLDNLLQVCFG
jgi:putative serine/threonine protein kinase